MADMARRDILPAVSRYTADLADSVSATGGIGIAVKNSFEKETILALCTLKDTAYNAIVQLEKVTSKAKEIASSKDRAVYYKEFVIPVMETLRKVVDSMEKYTCEDYWPMPNYGDLLFGVM